MFDLNKLVRPNILSLQPYSSARDEFTGDEGIFLDANENPFGTYNRYPDPVQSKLKQRISEIKSVAPNKIFLGNGSDEIIDLCFRIFCEPCKDKAVIFTPTYGMYEVSAAINNVELIKLSLDKNFQIDVSQALQVLNDDSIKLIFICSPNNPTGNTIKATEYIIANFKGIVVVDEAYIDFSNDGSLNSKIDKYQNLVVLQTLSKAWGMASLRIGMAFSSNNIIGLLNKVKPPYNISSVNYNTALENLSQELFEEQKLLILSERKRVYTALQSLSIVTKIYPTQTNFILIETPDANAVYNKLTALGIIIRNRNKVAKNCIRITIGNISENDALINALQNITV
jgi:histidinol-phosphate aminotransferase